MSCVLDGRPITEVGVVDDSEDGRQVLSEELTDANFLPRPFTGPFQSVDSLYSILSQDTQAAVCDHHFGPGNYAPFTGAELASRCYKEQFPTVLTTSYGIAEIEQIRLYQRNIPVVLTSAEANPDAFIRGWEMCINEFKGQFIPSRKPWRTLVRIADIDWERRVPVIHVVVPAWNPDEKVSLLLSNLPLNLHSDMAPGVRLHARVNIGAEHQKDLYFDEFEWDGL